MFMTRILEDVHRLSTTAGAITKVTASHKHAQCLDVCFIGCARSSRAKYAENHFSQLARVEYLYQSGENDTVL